MRDPTAAAAASRVFVNSHLWPCRESLARNQYGCGYAGQQHHASSYVLNHQKPPRDCKFNVAYPRRATHMCVPPMWPCDCVKMQIATNDATGTQLWASKADLLATQPIG